MPRDRDDDSGEYDRPIRRKGGMPLWAWLLIGGVMLGGLVIAGSVIGGALYFFATKASAPAKKTYTREEFRSLVVGKTKEEVIAAVGRPHATQSGVDEIGIMNVL